MKFAAMAAIVAALSVFAGCGGSSNSSTGGSSTASINQAEVSEAVKLIKEERHLENLKTEGVMRAGVLEETGSKRTAQSMEEAAAEFGEEADELTSQIEEYSNPVQRAALAQLEN